jgi:hypothetical protein
MQSYQLEPEYVAVLDAEKDLPDLQILDLLGTTGACVPEVMALTPASGIGGGHAFCVVLKTRKQRAGQPTKAALLRSPKWYVMLSAPLLVKDGIQSFLWAGRFKQTETIFPIVRRTVNRHIHALAERAGGPS